MLSLDAIAQIKAEIARLGELRKICNDEGIQKVIYAWIADLKKELAKGTKRDS
jgi:hypothetical protein